MNKIERLTKNQLTQDEVDLILEEAITQQLDREFVQSFESKLKERGIFKTGANNFNHRPFSSKLVGVIAAILIAIGLLIVYQMSKSTTSDPIDLAREYAVQYHMQHPGMSKGVRADRIRNQAILDYNNQNYVESLASFSSLGEKTVEDLFYMGMASFYSDQFNNAEVFLSQSLDDINYQQESRFFRGLTFLMEGNISRAIEDLEEISTNQFGYQEAQDLLGHLKE